MSVSECAVIWKTEIADRNKQIFDLRNKGYTQIEIASKFGISGQRVGQILNNYSPHKPKNKDLKSKAVSYVDKIVSSKKDTSLVAAIIESDLDSSVKVKLIEELWGE